MTLSSSLFRSQAPRIEESGNGNDSGNEEGDSSDGKVVNEENDEVEPSDAIARSPEVIQPADETPDQSDDVTEDQEGLPNGGTEEADLSGTPGNSRAASRTSGSMSHSENPSTENDHNHSRPNTAIEQVAQPETIANGEDADVDVTDTGEQLDDQHHVNTHEQEGAKDDGTDDSLSTNQNLGSSQDLNSTYTKIPAVDALAVNENNVSEVDVGENTSEETDKELSSQLDALQSDGDRNETDEKDGETETSTEQGLEFNDNQTNESKNEVTESDSDRITESQSRPCSHGNDSSKPRTAQETDVGQEDLQDQKSDKDRQTEDVSVEPETAEGEDSNPDAESKPNDGDESATAEDNSAADVVHDAEEGNDVTIDAIKAETETTEENGDADNQKPANLEEMEEKNGTPEDDETEKDHLDQPITLRSAGGSRAEVLAITPAPPEDDALGDDQKAVAEGNTGEFET